MSAPEEEGTNALNLNSNLAPNETECVPSASSSDEMETKAKKRKMTRTSEMTTTTNFYDIDQRLEEIAQKSKLSATNVKSILKNVIRNEYVIEMVKNIISNQENEPEFEPKITRSKLKAQSEENETDTDVDLEIDDNKDLVGDEDGVQANDEDDEDEDEFDQEYNPEEEEEDEEDDLDDLTEKEGSSQMDFEFPFESQENEEDKCQTDDNLNEASEDLICKRTRSKCFIEQEPPDTLQLPDVTDDLYGCSGIVDEDWKDFLNSLFVDSPSKMVEDDDLNDPEYNVFEDIDDLVDSWDLRNDKAVKVSNREYQELLGDDAQCEVVDVIQITNTDDESMASLSKWSAAFTVEDLSLIHQQMVQHVQLLTQMYLMTGQSETLSWIADSIKLLFRDLAQFSRGKKLSFFRPINYEGAAQIIEGQKLKISKEIHEGTSWRRRPVPPHVALTIARHPNVFYFPKLLPACGFYDVEETENSKPKTTFSVAEDRLIALGLEQFKPFKNKCYKYVRQLLVPVKTEEQIRTHIKNFKRKIKSISDENPLAHYFRHGTVPPPVFNTLSSIPPRNSFPDKSQLPNWLNQQVNPEESPVKRRHCPMQKYYLSPLKLQLKSWNPTSTSPFKQASNIVKKYKMYKITKFPIIKQKPVKGPEEDGGEASVKASGENEAKKAEADTTTATSVAAAAAGTATEDADGDGNEMDEDNEKDLEALMLASSTITKMRSAQNLQNKREGKKLLAARHKESTALLLSDNWLENDTKKAEKEQILIQHFLSRVREVLPSNEEYAAFLKCLSDFGQKRSSESSSSRSLRDLYLDIERILLKAGADEVLDEFVLFLSPKEAQECDKMFEYLYWKRFVTFVRKLEVCFSGDSSSLYRLYKGLSQLKQSESSIDKKKLRNTISKVVNNHPYLMHELSTLFLDEKSSEHLFTQDEDFDEISLPSDDEDDTSNVSRDHFENLSLSLTSEDTKFGTSECPCKLCHQNEDQENKKRHCVACSIKFMGGKVYLLQGQKKPQLAEVHYVDSVNIETSQSESNQPSSSESNADNVTAMPQKEVDSSTPPDEWTMEDDRVLLRLCKAKLAENKLETLVFNEISTELGRTTEQVSQRFEYLLEVFKQTKNSVT